MNHLINWMPLIAGGMLIMILGIALILFYGLRILSRVIKYFEDKGE